MENEKMHALGTAIAHSLHDSPNLSIRHAQQLCRLNSSWAPQDGLAGLDGVDQCDHP